MKIHWLIVAALAQSLLANANAQYQDWQHSGSLYILTTPDGANLPESASEERFPLLVRLHRDFFNFSQARVKGDDIRFSTSSGTPLSFQIEQWDAENGIAEIWVLIPNIKGNTQQEIRMHWGKPDAKSESNGKAVFNETNGYLSVWHMSSPIIDEVGTLSSGDVGTTSSAGMIGQARHLAGRQGIFCGEKISNYPSGANSHSSEAWFRIERPNTTILGWGNEGGGRGSKVRMQFRSPPHIHIDSDFADVKAASMLPMFEWIHVMHTYNGKEGKIYINGLLDGMAAPTLGIKSPARMWIGGWYNNYDFVGDIDEVRISRVARSADWVKLQYENQKPQQTLVGPIVQPGNVFSVSESKITLLEGKRATVSATAGGARKIYWSIKNGGHETVIAVDRLKCTFESGRVVGDQSITLQFKAVTVNGIKIQDIPILIKEDIQEPAFTIKAPATWDGRETVEVEAQVSNLQDMQAKHAGKLNCHWTISNIAVIKEIVPGKLVLKRAQNSGRMDITATVDNGGEPTVRTVTILVEEPKKDDWIARMPAKDEKPEDNQFYARADTGEGTLFYNGTLNQTADTVFLKVYAGEILYKNQSQKLSQDNAYAFCVPLKPGLIQYKVEFGFQTGGDETVLHTVTNVVCGDAYIIDGQSNAEATDVGKEDPTYTSNWIRSYGSMAGDSNRARLKLWGNAVCRDRNGGKLQIGYWGLELARRLVENHHIPICIINGAVGGSRIDAHQRNPTSPEDVATIYGRLLWRVKQAKLTHGIRGILWHQGENDQGADGPTGRYGWETYQQYFIDMAAGWKQDYPNIKHYYIFQIWPKACSMGINGSDNRLREVQRTLPLYFSNMGIMSTLGINPPGTCHYPPAGYAEIARLICPLVERDNYGTSAITSITPPNIKQTWYTSNKKDEIALEFDQPVVWSNELTSQFYLDGVKGKVISGQVSGNMVRLKLTAASTAQKITYLDSSSWNPKNLLRGENGIAALTFCEVPILIQKSRSP